MLEFPKEMKISEPPATSIFIASSNNTKKKVIIDLYPQNVPQTSTTFLQKKEANVTSSLVNFKYKIW